MREREVAIGFRSFITSFYKGRLFWFIVKGPHNWAIGNLLSAFRLQNVCHIITGILNMVWD